MSIATRWRILQVADSGFPTGGFAHSAGLEAAFRQGEVRTARQLAAYVRAHLWNVGHASLPFVGAAYDEPERLGALDAQVDASVLNHVANRASRTQGRAFLSTCSRVFDECAMVPFLDKVRAGEAHAHFAPVFGATLKLLGVERRDTLALYLYSALRGVASAAIRLGIVGPHEAQRLQGAMGPTLDRVLSHCESLRPSDVATVAPLLDIMGATHDAIYSRLFQT
jgi:urease accessory protein